MEPLFGGDDHATLAGAAIDGADALLRHSYLASYSYDFDNDLNAGSLQYFYDNKWQFSALNVNTLEWRTQLSSIERNMGVLPVGLGNVGANLFIDHGAAWQEGQSSDYLTSAGVELSTELVVFYALPLPVRLGYAHGFDQHAGKDEVYLTVGYQF